MALSPLDEYMIHQTPDTLDRVFTSDRNFYDRHYYNFHSMGDEIFVVMGMGQYPNLGTADAFVCVVYKQKQYVLRASKELGSNRSEMKVGPFEVHVVEGLKSMRLTCEDNEHDISFDITFNGTAPVVEEPPQFIRKGARVVMNSSRYSQMGVWSGELKIKGDTIDLNSDKYLGVRDHSWGVRPVGEREPMGILINEYIERYGFFHMWAPMQFDDFQLKVFIEENADGSLIIEECVKVDSYEKGGEVYSLGKPKHKIKYKPGTRELESAELFFKDEKGKDLVVKATAVTCAYLAAGTGYYPNEEWTHGQYHGPFKMEEKVYELETHEQRKALGPLYETIVRYELSTGEVTYGMFENMSIGHHDPYGFDSFEAVAE